MGVEQLQFIFSLFSFLGVVGILFYLILAKVKQDEQQESVELETKMLHLEHRVEVLEKYLKEEKEAPKEEQIKQEIIALYEEGKDLVTIEESLNIPRAKIEMVLKFHNLKKSDNWKNSVD